MGFGMDYSHRKSKSGLAVRPGLLTAPKSRCAHCGRYMNDFAGGMAKIGPNNLCHPNAKNRPNCYKLVMNYKHPMPCDTTTCYEDHENFMTYVKGRQSETIDNIPFDDISKLVDDGGVQVTKPVRQRKPID